MAGVADRQSKPTIVADGFHSRLSLFTLNCCLAAFAL